MFINSWSYRQEVKQSQTETGKAREHEALVREADVVGLVDKIIGEGDLSPSFFLINQEI